MHDVLEEMVLDQIQRFVSILSMALIEQAAPFCLVAIGCQTLEEHPTCHISMFAWWGSAGVPAASVTCKTLWDLVTCSESNWGSAFPYKHGWTAWTNKIGQPFLHAIKVNSRRLQIAASRASWCMSRPLPQQLRTVVLPRMVWRKAFAVAAGRRSLRLECWQLGVLCK